MKIRTRLAIRFSIIVASILMFFAFSVYYFASSYRKQQFYERLNEKANNYAQLLLKLSSSDTNLIKVIDRNTAYLPQENIIVYNLKHKLLFNTIDHSDTLNASFLNQVQAKKEIKYMSGNNEVFAMLYKNTNMPLIVIVSAYDKDGLKELQNLKIILLAGLFSGILISMFAGWLYARQALNPISDIITQVETINTTNLAQRVKEGNGKDEIAKIATTFNRMLDRIQYSFELQKSFVSNSSHELRTPLTAITGQLEVALMGEKTQQEYKTVLSSVLEDAQNLNRLTNGLLELAQADMDISKLKVQKVRLDELLWQTRNYILKKTPQYTIHVTVNEFPDEESRLEILGNEYLLRSALANIIDNACKFSNNHTAHIFFKTDRNFLEITCKDEGIGIPEEEIQFINEPFYRASNAKKFLGHGLGMSLAHKIISLHNGQMKVDSKCNEYTIITVRLPVLK